MQERIAKLISIIFHPIIWLSLGFVIPVIKSYENIPQAPVLIVSLILLLTVFPIIVLRQSLRYGKASDIYLTHFNERPRFFIFFASIAIPILLIIFNFLILPKDIQFFIWLVAIGILTYTLITPFLKISAHIGVVTCIALSLFLLYGNPFEYLFLLLPPIGWARYELKHHTFRELTGGFLISSLLTIIIWQIIY